MLPAEGKHFSHCNFVVVTSGQRETLRDVFCVMSQMTDAKATENLQYSFPMFLGRGFRGEIVSDV